MKESWNYINSTIRIGRCLFLETTFLGIGWVHGSHLAALLVFALIPYKKMIYKKMVRKKDISYSLVCIYMEIYTSV